MTNETDKLSLYRLEVDKLVKSLQKLKKIGDAEVKIKASAQSLSDLSKQIQRAVGSKSFNVKSSIKIDTTKFDTSKIDIRKIKPLFNFITKVNELNTGEFATKSSELTKGANNIASGVSVINELSTTLFALKYKELSKTLSKPIFKEGSFSGVQGFSQYVSALSKLSSIPTTKLNSMSKGLKNLDKSLPQSNSLDSSFVNDFSLLVKSYRKLDKEAPQGSSTTLSPTYTKNSRGKSIPILKAVDSLTDFKTSGAKAFIANMKAINELSFNPQLIKDLSVIGNTASSLSRVRNPLFRMGGVGNLTPKQDLSSIVGTVLSTLLSASFIAKLSSISKEILDYQGYSLASGFDVLSNRVAIESLGGNATRVGQEILQKRRALFDAQIFGSIDNKQMALMGMLGTSYTSSFSEIRSKAGAIRDSQLRDYLVSSIYGDEMATLIRRQFSAYAGANKVTRGYLNKMFSFNTATGINIGEYSRFFLNIEILFARVKHLVQAVSGGAVLNINQGLQRINTSLQAVLGNTNTLKNLSSLVGSFFDGFTLPFKLIVNAVASITDTLSVIMGTSFGGSLLGGALKFTGVLIALKSFFIGFKVLGKILGGGIFVGLSNILPKGLNASLGKILGGMLGKWFLPSLFLTDVAEGIWGVVKGHLKGFDLGQFILKTIIQIIGASLAVLVNPVLGLSTMMLADSVSKETINLFKRMTDNSDEQARLMKEQNEILKNPRTNPTGKNNDSIYIGAN